MITPSVISKLDFFKQWSIQDISLDGYPEITNNKTNFLFTHLYKYEIPINESNTKESIQYGFCLIPQDHAKTYPQLKKQISIFRDKLAYLFLTVPNSYVQRKYMATIRMLESLISTIDELAGIQN